MPRTKLFRWLAPALLLTSTFEVRAGDDVGPLVRSLWLVQKFGAAESVANRNDQRVTGTLSKALGKEGVLTSAGVRVLMDPSTFEKLAGGDGKLDSAEVQKALDAD